MERQDIQGRSETNVPGVRLGIGLVQGLLLLLLYQSAAHGVWPATNLYVFLPLVQLGLYLPLAAIVSIGHLPLRPVLIWLGALAVVIAGLDVYAVYRFNLPLSIAGTISETIEATNEVATVTLFFYLPIGLLIAHTLFVAAQSRNRASSPYENYFELAWKHGIQVAASGAFTGVFWLLLALGGGLFDLIRIETVWEMFKDARFAIPATALVVALALHITDVRPGIVAGMRTLALTLLSWLLPVLVVLIGSFLTVLPFAGFDLLWSTNVATALLLAASAALIVLINTVYQDGPPRAQPPRALKVAASAGAVALTPLALLAGYGLALRVEQYGWTSDRIIAAACVVIAAGYAGGYAYAVFKRGPWLQVLERVNVAMSFVVLAVLVGLFSPAADPARISVGSQVERLKDGRTSPVALDVAYLRFDAGRYGIAALRALIADPATDAALKERAIAALAQKSKNAAAATLGPAVLAANLEVLPQGQTLPETFLRQDWADVTRGPRPDVPACLVRALTPCKAIMADLDRDGADEVVVVRDENGPPAGVFKLNGDVWELVGQISASVACPQALEALRRGSAATAPSSWDDLVIGGTRFPIQALLQDPGCN